jgi:hypothetical protein
MFVKLEIQILGEILQVRDNGSRMNWTGLYPDQTFSARGVPFTYDELRGMGNGKHVVQAKSPSSEVAGGSSGSDQLPSKAPRVQEYDPHQ